jgi:hypothetical protein
VLEYDFVAENTSCVVVARVPFQYHSATSRPCRITVMQFEPFRPAFAAIFSSLAGSNPASRGAILPHSAPGYAAPEPATAREGADAGPAVVPDEQAPRRPASPSTVAARRPGDVPDMATAFPIRDHHD